MVTEKNWTLGKIRAEILKVDTLISLARLSSTKLEMI
jgi:hypothetical protein